MSSFLDQLNLRPQERRLLVVVAAVVFVVLNIWLVWPHFDDWKTVRNEREKALMTLAAYQREVAKIPVYEAKLIELESAGSNIIPEERDLDLALAVQAQSRASGLNVTTSNPKPKSSSLSTNHFFDEQALDIQVSTGNEELVKFLVSLASTNSLIRVQNLTLRPAAGATRLDGTITLVASYQKQAATASPVAATNSGALKAGGTGSKLPNTDAALASRSPTGAAPGPKP